MKHSVRYLPILLALTVTSLMNAGTIGVNASGGGVFVNTGTFTLGYSFLVNSPISVTSLGVYDHGSDGLNVSHDVGLWNSAGTLLASTTVGSGVSGVLNSGFRFSAVTPLVLSVGSTYYVGSVNGIDGDQWLQDPTTLIAAPEITYLSRRYEASGGGLVFPALAGSGTTGYFGGNFEFGGRTEVPEPSTLALAGLGFVALALLRRRQQCR